MRYSTVVMKEGMEWVKKGGFFRVYLENKRRHSRQEKKKKKARRKHYITLYRNNLSRVIYFQKEGSRHGMEEIRRTGKKKSLTKGRHCNKIDISLKKGKKRE